LLPQTGIGTIIHRWLTNGRFHIGGMWGLGANCGG